MIFKENFTKYILVGLSCQIIDYFFTLIIFDWSGDIFLSNSIGYSFATTISYILHINYTFRKYSNNFLYPKQVILFLSSCFLGSISGFILLKILLIIDMELRYLKVFQLIIIATIQYYFNSRFTFRKR